MGYHRTHVSGEICCRVVCIALQKLLKIRKIYLNVFTSKGLERKWRLIWPVGS